MFLPLFAFPLAAQTVNVPVTWESIPSVEEYTVEIMDSAGNIIRNVQTIDTKYMAVLPPGRYSVRITGINKFKKQEGQSEWTSLEVKQSVKKEEKSVPLLPGYIYIGLAYNPLKILGGIWGDMYGSFSFISASVYLGMDLSYFAAMRKIPVINRIGIEYNFNFNLMRNGKLASKSIVDSEMQQLNNGFGIFLKHNFGLPLYFIIRGRGGISMTVLKQEDTGGKTSYRSSKDLFYSAGAAVQFPIGSFFMEAGANYESVMYIDGTFNAISAFFMIGIRF